MSPGKYVPAAHRTLGTHLRPAHNAETRAALERIRVAWETGVITWDAAVSMADRAKLGTETTKP